MSFIRRVKNNKFWWQVPDKFAIKIVHEPISNESFIISFAQLFVSLKWLNGDERD
jgi:hypothetical protein